MGCNVRASGVGHGIASKREPASAIVRGHIFIFHELARLWQTRPRGDRKYALPERAAQKEKVNRPLFPLDYRDGKGPCPDLDSDSDPAFFATARRPARSTASAGHQKWAISSTIIHPHWLRKLLFHRRRRKKRPNSWGRD